MSIAAAAILACAILLGSIFISFGLMDLAQAIKGRPTTIPLEGGGTVTMLSKN